MSKSPRSLLRQKFVNTFWHLPKNILLSTLNGSPGKKLNIIGITGTDGKTSTCILLYHVLKNAGYKVGFISTIGAKIENEWLDTQLHMTSPDPSIIQSLLSRMQKAKLDFVILEVTSISLDQHRFWGCNFLLGVFLNIAQEHLDYHKDMDTYLKAKTKLLNISKIAIANGDDAMFAKLQQNIRKKLITFGTKPSNNIQAKNIVLDENFLSFNVDNLNLQTNSNYEYQTYNILACLGVTRALSIPDTVIANTIINYPETKGRREEIANTIGIKCIVDYGHTPQAFLSTFSSLKKTYPKQSLISIFGATGDRDKEKRPLMGEIATKYCQLCILTTDDIRHEKIKDVNQQIISGFRPGVAVFNLKLSLPTKQEVKEIRILMKKKPVYLCIENRQDAITTGILIAQKGDIVITLGIGHQNTILIGNTEYPWSESEAVRSGFKIRSTFEG